MELKSNKYVCDICNKQYTKKTSFDKHKLVCEFKIKSKRELEIEVEESSDIPTYNQLVQIVQEMSLKIIKMEEKIEENNVFLVDKNTEDIYSDCYESVKNIIEKYKDNSYMSLKIKFKLYIA